MALVRNDPFPFDLEQGSRRGLGFLCLERTVRLRRRGRSVTRQSLISSQDDLNDQQHLSGQDLDIHIISLEGLGRDVFRCTMIRVCRQFPEHNVIVDLLLPVTECGKGTN